MLEKIIKDHMENIPETMIILGSGIQDVTYELDKKKKVSYQELFAFKTDESIGHSGDLYMGFINKIPVLMLAGRRHYYEDVSDKDMRMMIQSFAKIGVKNIIITNACGSMNKDFRPGDIMVIEDHINMMGRNPLVGNNESSLGPRFVDMSEPYDIKFRKVIDQAASDLSIDIKHGVYVSYIGPSYETKAEIRAFKILGGDVVGMSTVPEVIIARHANMRVLGLSIITNMSTGISENKLSHEEVLEVGKITVKKLSKLLVSFLKEINK
ncbi:MAG: purine-nucleoside phosphorylase [Candidatus Izemoplasmatales bacterium]